MAFVSPNAQEAPAHWTAGEQVGSFDETEPRFGARAPEEQRRDGQEELVDEPRLDQRAEDARPALRQDRAVASGTEHVDRSADVEIVGRAERDDGCLRRELRAQPFGRGVGRQDEGAGREAGWAGSTVPVAVRTASSSSAGRPSRRRSSAYAAPAAG